MKMKLNPGSWRNKRTQHGASNTLLIIMLLLIPFLHKPVPSLEGTVRIIFEKQRAAGVDTPPLTINVAVKDELIPVGSATLLLLLFFYVRRKEGAEGVNDEAMPGMEMDDEEVKDAWNQVKRFLSDEDDEEEN